MLKKETIDKLKAFFILLWTKVLAWLLMLAKEMWEEYIKAKLAEQLHELIKIAIRNVQEYRSTEIYEVKKKEIYDNVFNLLVLPKGLNWLKAVIKPIISDAVSKRIDEALLGVNERI